ncbi:MAG TPA: GerMN domain-containing protein [bacterium]|nr:GerMN domain-containing protein [bacterium]
MTARRRRATKRRGANTSGLWWALAAVVIVAALVTGARVLRWPRPPAGPRAGIEVFFVRYSEGGRTGALVTVRRPATPGPVDVRVAAALRELLAGPSAEERGRGIVSEIPPGTGLRSVHVHGSTATIDLTAAFANGGGSTSMLARLWQVVYTATQTSGIHAVQILIGGRHEQALGGEGVAIDRPIERPASMPVL